MLISTLVTFSAAKFLRRLLRRVRSDAEPGAVRLLRAGLRHLPGRQAAAAAQAQDSRHPCHAVPARQNSLSITYFFKNICL